MALAGCEGGAADGTGAKNKVVERVSASPSVTAGAATVLLDDEKSADAGKPLVIAVLDNDTATAGGSAVSQPLTEVLKETEYRLTVDSAPSHGTAEFKGAQVTYTPTAGYSGQDQFTYRLSPTGPGTVGGTAVVRITVTAPKAKPTPTRTPVASKKPAAPKHEVYYRNCDAARAAGAAPVRRGDEGYGSHLDRDGDGVGCEPYSGGADSGGSSTSGGGGDSGGSGGGGSTYYANCAAARAAGAAPVHRGDPGYGRHLDRDGDGVGCE